MRVGAIFPTKEIGIDPGAIRAWAEAVEELGFAHILIYDHVLGADTANRPDWQGPYDIDDPFHEPLVTLGYLAALTDRVELATGIVILPQRQAVLVAKQAAELDLLSGGRLRLGVGLGWNAVEFEALGEDFDDRGARIDEQVEVMRRLWTERVVSFEGEDHRVAEAGLNPMPLQRPIPLWMGGGFAPAALRRIGRLADGWMPLHPPNERGRQALAAIREAAETAGRDPDAIGIEGRISLDPQRRESWGEMLEKWRGFGAGHVTMYTMDQGLAGADEHIGRLEEFLADVPGALGESGAP